MEYASYIDFAGKLIGLLTAILTCYNIHLQGKQKNRRFFSRRQRKQEK